jgi:hypothetical protein
MHMVLMVLLQHQMLHKTSILNTTSLQGRGVKMVEQVIFIFRPSFSTCYTCSMSQRLAKLDQFDM